MQPLEDGAILRALISGGDVAKALGLPAPLPESVDCSSRSETSVNNSFVASFATDDGSREIAAIEVVQPEAYPRTEAGTWRVLTEILQCLHSVNRTRQLVLGQARPVHFKGPFRPPITGVANGCVLVWKNVSTYVVTFTVAFRGRTVVLAVLFRGGAGDVLAARAHLLADKSLQMLSKA
jgi:hypothetical protein